MLKAYEVMTHGLATCAPDASVANVAATMRERDIGNVLVVEDGKLRGIVTDRDLATQALTGKDDPLETPISKFMSTQLVTGEVGWSLEHVARTMAHHQIRRLPIVRDDQVVGIVSLGDVARFEGRKHVVKNSLQAISIPNELTDSDGTGHGKAWVGFALTALVTTLLAWLTWNRTGQMLRKQLANSDFFQTAQHTLSAARDRIDEAAASEPVRSVRTQVAANLNEISAQLPSLEVKAPKHKPAWVN